MRSTTLPSLVPAIRRQLLSVPSTTYSMSSLVIEDLDAVVGSIRHVDAAPGIDRDAVRHIELARPRAFTAPPLNELSFLRELHDPCVRTLSIGDEDVAVLRHRQVRP